MFLITHDTVSNRAALAIRWVPRKFLGRTALWPRGGGWRLWVRLVFEVEILRYLTALAPFVIATLIWRDYALAIAQAPIPMLILIWLVEARLLRVSPRQRAKLVTEAEAERGLDLLRERARLILGQIAAGRDLDQGRLHLVIEQSEMLRIPPLTLVSVQSDAGPELLRLTRDEQALIRSTLFDADLSERALQRIGLARRIEAHDLTFDPTTLSAHARLRAMLARGATGQVI